MWDANDNYADIANELKHWKELPRSYGKQVEYVNAVIVGGYQRISNYWVILYQSRIVILITFVIP